MNAKHIVFALALVSFTAPAFAATEWYIVKNETTKKCEVVDKKPAKNSKMMQIGMNMFKTKAEAEAAMKGAMDCGGK